MKKSARVRFIRVLKPGPLDQDFSKRGVRLNSKDPSHRPSSRFHVGIDAGSVSLNVMVIDEQRRIVREFSYERHLGKVEERTRELIETLYREMGEENIRSISFTGNHGKKLGERLGVFYEFETITQVLGAVFIQPDVRTIISMGGQDTALFQITHDAGGQGQGTWELEHFNTNGPCASGTGSFIDQQAERLATAMYAEEIDTSPEKIDKILADFILLGAGSRKPANVACRCTVFTKSDMIHLQNKGEKLEDIIYGLHLGNARNYMSTIVSNRVLAEPILFVGGLSLNGLQVKAFRDYFPNLIVPPHNTSIGALGVALQALSLDKKDRVNLSDLRPSDVKDNLDVPVAPRLALKYTEFVSSNEIPRKPLKTPTRAFLGIDIGSTTTKYALMNEAGDIIHKCYVPTRGKPIEVTQGLLRTIRDEVGNDVIIAGTATTGSGRNVVGDFLNADLIIDEITAHARGAVKFDPAVDTIFEIGGQDSKYIYISNTYPLDFDMNKVCAAGTGSFLHELASKYGINIVEEFQEIALSSRTPVKLAERCTVFMESDLVSFLQKGVAIQDLMAGLCYAIVHNYLNRVVERRKIGKRVMFLGGPSLNRGVVAAFENVLGRRILVPAHREVLGAYGAALSVQEKMGLAPETGTRFRGLESAIRDRMAYTEKICRADPNCHNQCKLKIYDFDGRKSVWGGECGRYEVTRTEGGKKDDHFRLRHRTHQQFLSGVVEELRDEPMMVVDGRPTVGMQNALYGHQTAIFWAHFFDRLGYRLVMTPPTNIHISKVGIESMIAETCYPVKVSHGHVRELVGKTRFLFIPAMINMSVPHDSETGFYCPLVQGNGYMVRLAHGLDPASVLSPVVRMKRDADTLALELAEQLASPLRVNRKQIRNAVRCALNKQHDFARELCRQGRRILQNHSPDEPIVIVTGRPYNLYDERLNLRLGRNLAKIGVAALPMDFIDVSGVDLSLIHI